MGYIISNQHLNRKLDPNIHVLEEIYNIIDKSIVHVLVTNCTHKYVLFNKGQCIGYIGSSIDHMAQSAINSLTTQWMLDQHIQPDTFKPPYIPSQMMWGHHSINYCRHLNHNLHRMKQVLEPLISLKCKLIWVTQNMSCKGQTPTLWSTMTG